MSVVGQEEKHGGRVKKAFMDSNTSLRRIVELRSCETGYGEKTRISQKDATLKIIYHDLVPHMHAK